jgi:N-acetyl-anhydromuramyl-L-alanine amidase AmpD
MASLNKLVKYLMVTYNIPVTRVLGHRDTKPTHCPGQNFNLAVVRRAVQQQLAESGDTTLIETADMDTIDTDYTAAPTDPVTASAELLQDVSEPVSR